MSQRMIYQTDSTRQRILTEAEHCFSEHGFFDTQMKDIATAVGMSRNTLYRYYRDKFDLGFAILEKALSAGYGELEGELDAMLAAPELNIRQQLGGLLERIHCRPETEINSRFIAEFDAYYAGERIPEDFRERLLNAAGSSFFDRLDALVKRGQREGNIRNDIEAHLISTTLSNAIQSFHHRMLLRNAALIELDPGVPTTLTPLLIKILIDGLAPPSNS